MRNIFKTHRFKETLGQTKFTQKVCKIESAVSIKKFSASLCKKSMELVVNLQFQLNMNSKKCFKRKIFDAILCKITQDVLK